MHPRCRKQALKAANHGMIMAHESQARSRARNRLHSMMGVQAKQRIGEMLRVDHAGEYGAVQIYKGQLAVLRHGAKNQRHFALVSQMAEQEREHLESFDDMLRARQIRPTLMHPIWSAAGFGLGAISALISPAAAHAVTAAVEEVISDHYHEQSQELAQDEPELASLVTRFAQDEAEHRHVALEEGAEKAPAYSFLSAAVRLGCRIAIRVSEKI